MGRTEPHARPPSCATAGGAPTHGCCAFLQGAPSGPLGGRAPQNTPGGSGPSLLPCVHSTGLLRGGGLDLGPAEPPRPPCLGQGPPAPPPRTQEPNGAPPAASCSPPEPQDCSQALGEPLPVRKAGQRGGSLRTGPLTPAAGLRGPRAASWGSPGLIAREGPASACSATPEEGGQTPWLPSPGQLQQGPVGTPRPVLGEALGDGPASASTRLEGRSAPLDPEQPADVRASPSKAPKRRSLEGVRRQSRVELSDSSSDDEGRLVIEL